MRPSRGILVAATAAFLCSPASPTNAQEIYSNGFETSDSCDWSGETDANDSEESSFQVPDTGDCAGNTVTLASFAHPTDDVDYFSFLGVDEFGCPMDLFLDVTADSPVEVCAYLECVTGTSTDVTCPNGTSEATSPLGQTGCCLDETSMQGEFDITFDCIGTLDDTTNFWIRVSDPQNNCSHYSVTANP